MRYRNRELLFGLLGWLLVILVCCLMSCSPQKRLNRLIKNNPELAKTDTVFSSKEFTVPGFHLDSNFKASENVSGLTDIIENYRDYLDSLRRAKLTNQISNFITNRSCLEDTLRIQLNNNGAVKVWQTKNIFYYTVNQPQKKYQITVPVNVQKFNVVTKNDWLMYWLGISTILFILVILFFLKMWLKF